MASGEKRKKKRLPQSTRKPSSVDDLFGAGVNGNLLHPDFIDRKDVYAWFQRRHFKGNTFIDKEGFYRQHGHEWKVPYGVRQALRVRLVYNQMAVKYPFYVTWVSPKTGKRHKKFVGSIASGIVLIAERVQYVDPDAAIVSRVVGYNIPPKLRGKFPRKMNGRLVYWCPLSMNARRFKRAGDQTFYAIKKFWNPEKMRYDFKDVKLAVLECEVCRCSNKNNKFRASNQPYEVRKIKRGVRRVKKRRPRRKG